MEKIKHGLLRNKGLRDAVYLACFITGVSVFGAGLPSCKNPKNRQTENIGYLNTKYIDELAVNSENKYRTVVNKSEEQGIQDLKKLAKEARYGEAWIYLPEQSLWIEVGKDEKPSDRENDYVMRKIKENPLLYKTYKEMNKDETGNLSQINLDSLAIYELFEDNKNVVQYSVRPDFARLFMGDEDADESNTSVETANKRFRFEISTASLSDSDLLAMVKESAMLYKANPDGKFTSRICGRRGITEYNLTKKE